MNDEIITLLISWFERTIFPAIIAVIVSVITSKVNKRILQNELSEEKIFSNWENITSDINDFKNQILKYYEELIIAIDPGMQSSNSDMVIRQVKKIDPQYVPNLKVKWLDLYSKVVTSMPESIINKFCEIDKLLFPYLFRNTNDISIYVNLPVMFQELCSQFCKIDMEVRNVKVEVISRKKKISEVIGKMSEEKFYPEIVKKLTGRDNQNC